MAKFPTHLHYTVSHEWARHDGDASVTVGISDHAQAQLGDLVFVELPEENTHVAAGDEVVVVESVKTAADVYSPISGTVIAVNDALRTEPAMVNQDPYGAGWLFRLKADDIEELNTLLDAQGYENKVSDE